MCVILSLFSALSRRVGALQISVAILIRTNPLAVVPLLIKVVICVAWYLTNKGEYTVL